MKSQPFHQSSMSGFAAGSGQHKGKRHVMTADGNTASKTITTDPFISSINVDDASGSAVHPIIPDPVISDPKLEVNFATLSCDEVKALIDYINTKTSLARLTPSAASYYSNKLALLNLALKTCGSTGTGGTMPPGGNSPGTVLLPVIPAIIPGLTSGGLVDSGGSGSGSGAGGGGSSATPTKKPFPWWAVIALGLLVFSGYETNKAA